MGILALAGCVFGGFLLTADSIAEERREGTLGLLFLTDLKCFEVVLGKLVAAWVQGIFSLVAAIPILALPLLMGGVTGAEFARFILVSILTLFWSLTIGLVVSAFAQDARHAMALSFLLVVILAGVCPALWWAQKLTWNNPALDFLLWPSPWFALTKSFGNFFSVRSGPADFWHATITVGSTAFVCLASAVLILPQSWRSAGERPASQRKKLARATAIRSSRALLNLNPMHWLGLRDRRIGQISTRLLLLLALLWGSTLLLSLLFKNRVHELFTISFFILFGVHVLLKVAISFETTRRFNQDRASGALELLVVTPLPVGALLFGHQRAIHEQFRGPRRILIFMNVASIIFAGVFHQTLDMHWKDYLVFVETYCGGILVLYADVAALGWVGMWAGLTSPKQNRAVMRTIARVLLPPWIVILLLVFIQPNINGPGSAAFVFGSWFLFSLVVSIWNRSVIQRKLLQRFRQTLAQNS
jgi:ABC-type transport system involved in cytochrome c biogenesis permease component